MLLNLSHPAARDGLDRGAVLQRAVDVQIRDLIHKMATENGWGAPRVHRELAMLGFDVSERTVSRYLHGLRRRPEARQGWLTFLRNHRELIAAMDLFVVCTATLPMLYVLFVIRHGRRPIAHFNVTQHPTATWVTQQIREAFPAMDLFVVCTATFRLLYVLVVIRHGRRQIVHFNVTAHWNRSRRPARRSSHQRQRRRRGLRPVASTTSSSRRHRGAEPASPATPASWAAMRRLLHLRPLVAPPSSKLPNIAINA